MVRCTVAKFTWQLRRIFKASITRALTGRLRHSTIEVACLRARSDPDANRAEARITLLPTFVFDVRFATKSGHVHCTRRCPLCANSDRTYSITSSERTCNVGGMSMPRVFAVLRFMTSSNLVGRTTGSSEGFAPLRI